MSAPFSQQLGFHASLLDAVAEALFVHDPADGRIVFVNRAACDLYGWPAEELLGMEVGDLSEGEPPYSQREAAEWVRRAGEQGPQRFEWRARARDGRLFWVEVCLRRARVAGHDLVVASVRDIDEAKRGQEALREAEAHMTAAFDLAPVGMSLATPEGVFVRVNPSLCRMLDRTAEELVGRRYAEFTHPEDRGPSEEFLRRLVAGEVDSYSLRKRYLRPDGSEVWVETHAALVRDAEGRPLHVLCQLVDLTLQRAAEVERERLQNRLRHAQVLEAVGRLAAGVAHDFNNILGSILGCAYVGRLEVPEGSVPHSEFERISGLCRRGGEITRRLLAVARREGGRVESVGVKECLEEIRVLLDHTLPKTVTLVMDVEPGLPPARADRSLLTTALLNLCLNARDAMPAGGTLTLAARSSDRVADRGIEIRVADTGSGIPVAIRDRVFEPFLSTKEAGDGVGLGLAEAHAGVTGWGGSLELETSGPEGSVFRLWLPAADPGTPPAGRRAGGSAAAHPLTDRVVVVVEDEEGVADLMVLGLEAAGYRVERARTGLQALDRLQQDEPVGLLVLDLVLPELDGTQVYRLIQGVAPELPVVLVTGREDLAANLARPEHPVLAKPFAQREFLAAVARALGG
ncbi:hybrid sensor histidine kinase/response regulator [Deferrisoma camini]|uniref:hybrid sensor histidine kinase/response regulator n=1 Tax=Deferrisoma camini TaxID=1035120 RepID=UPI00046D0B08|nr:PAS domain-containing sensor histidine kinase [Deferrisoma camini]